MYDNITSFEIMWTSLGSNSGTAREQFVLIGPASLLKHKTMKQFEQRPYVPACVVNPFTWPREEYEIGQNHETS